MASLNMEGPYSLNFKEIENCITRTSPGNYALGYIKEKSFRVCYVGRADNDVNQRLKQWVSNTQRPQFKFSYASSPKAAFEKECNNYHDFDPPDNKIHPTRPANTNWKCPCCDVFG
ncbi:MAG: hypothetical protein ACOX2B_07015 [Syntrophothermaceae bacterium]